MDIIAANGSEKAQSDTTRRSGWMKPRIAQMDADMAEAASVIGIAGDEKVIVRHRCLSQMYLSALIRVIGG
jgi:hypothetical protein